MFKKRCWDCKQLQPANQFHKLKKSKDGLQGRCKPCRLAHYAIHRDEIIAKVADWWKANPERVNANNRRWKRAHPEKVAAGKAKWRRENPEKARGIYQRYRARKAKLPATLTVEEWRDILIEWGHRCAYCGISESKLGKRLEQEHVIPTLQGGGYIANNIVPACAACNTRKGGRTPEQAGMVFSSHYDFSRKLNGDN